MALTKHKFIRDNSNIISKKSLIYNETIDMEIYKDD